MDWIGLDLTFPITDPTWIFLLVLLIITITGYSGIDPEVNTQGLDPGVDPLNRYPSTRSFTLGAMFTF